MKNFQILKPLLTSFIVFVIIQITACSTDENLKSAESENSAPDINSISETNNIAIISGTDKGSVIEDVDPDGDNLLEINGKLNITDSDAGEVAFFATSVDGDYGNLTIDADGNWSYNANNSQAVIQSLSAGNTLNDRLTISSLDGTTHIIVITIFGTDEANQATDIVLSWVAPTERENSTPLTLSEIAGYKIYYGPSQGQYTNNIAINDNNAMGYTFKNLSAGTYYFVMTTIDAEGRESVYSPEVIKII